MSFKSAKSDEHVTYSDSDDNSSLLSDRSLAEQKRSSYSESFSDNSGGRSYPDSRQTSAKYSASVVSKTTGTGTHRNSEHTINRSNMTSGIRTIGKKKSSLGAKVTTNNSKKIDPITARILSAHHRRRAQANNHAGEIRRENESLQNELKSLRIQCKRQEKALHSFENTQSALPQVLQRFEDDKRVLKDRLRKAKDTERRLEREKKRVELENDKQNRKLRQLNEIVKKKNLDERFELQQKLTDAEERAQNAEESLRESNKKVVLQTQSLDRQLKKETRRRAKAEKQLQVAQTEMRSLKEKMTERDRQLSVLNIYTQRTKKSSRNQSFHGHPGSGDEHNMSLLSIQYSGATRKALESSSPRISVPGDPITISADPSPLMPKTKEEPSVPDPAFLTEIVPEVEKPPSPQKRAQKVQAQAAVDVISPPPLEAPKTQKEKSAGDLLDEMLGLSEPNLTKTPKAPNPDSPTLLDLDLGAANQIASSPTPRDDSPTLFNFEPKNNKKDAILAQLRDLHANSEPDTILGNTQAVPEISKPVKSEKKSIFNIFDEAPVEPKIEPKETRIPRDDPSIESIKVTNDFKDDEFDQLLTLKPSSNGISRGNKSDYNFSEPIKHLHEGKASNGTDYRAPKKENLIDNLFGNTGRSTQASTSSHAIGAHGSVLPDGAKRIKSNQRQKPIFLF